MFYRIDFDEFKKSYKIDIGFKHDGKKKLVLFPYNTKYKESKKSEILNFDQAVTSFSKSLSKKEIKSNELNIDEIVEKTINNVNIKDNNKNDFRKIIKEIFFKKINNEGQEKYELIDFHPSVMNYRDDKEYNGEIGRFLYSVLLGENAHLEEDIKKIYDVTVDNKLIELFLKQFPVLKDNNNTKKQYTCVVPYIKEVFIEDLKYLLKDADFYSANLKKFLKFYNLTYGVQAALILNEMFNDIEYAPQEIYYNIGNEKSGIGRLSYKIGWKNVDSCLHTMFSHVNCIDMINHLEQNKVIGTYREFKDYIKKLTNEEIEIFAEDIDKLSKLYSSQIKEISIEDFEYKKYDNKAEQAIYKFFAFINKQFLKSTRKKRQNDFATWFIEGIKSDFLKKGIGYRLNLNDEYIILITQLIIKDKEKVKLNTIFEEFKRRGIFFDKESKNVLISLYEKLNILEKKSDSGDAQYVKSII